MSGNEKRVPKRRFKEFENAEGWEECKLDEIATMKARIGWQGLTQKEFLDDGDYYLITGTDFDNGQIDFTNCHYINKERYNQDVNIQVRNGDVLITKDGTIGKVAYIMGMDKPATLNAGVFVIKGKDNNISNLYLYHYLAAPFLLDYADKQATGGTIKHLNQNVLVNFPIPLPKVEEQQRIASYLTNLDKLITIHQRKLDKMKALKKAYLTDMFPAEGERKPKLRFDGFTDDWEQCRLSDVAIFIDGNYGEKYPKDNEFIENGVPFFTSAVIGTSGVFDKKNVKYISKEKNSVLVKAQSLGGDIILTNRGASMGVVAQIPLEYGLVNIGPQLTRIRGTEKADNLFLLSMFKNPSYNQKLLSINSGSAMNFVGLESLGKFEFMCPKLDEQAQIGVFFKNIDNLITLHQNKIEKLQNIKKAYLNEMFI